MTYFYTNWEFSLYQILWNFFKGKFFCWTTLYFFQVIIMHLHNSNYFLKMKVFQLHELAFVVTAFQWGLLTAIINVTNTNYSQNDIQLDCSTFNLPLITDMVRDLIRQCQYKIQWKFTRHWLVTFFKKRMLLVNGLFLMLAGCLTSPTLSLNLNPNG